LSEAFGRLDVLEVDAAERRFEQLDGLDDEFGIGRVDFEVEHVDVREPLEEDGLALHHRLARERPDVPESQHRGAVGNHGHEVPPVGVPVRVGRILLDLEAGNRHAGRVGQRQVPLGFAGLGGNDLQFPRPPCGMVSQSIFPVIRHPLWSPIVKPFLLPFLREPVPRSGPSIL
jgi:hypothetical protein